MREFSKLDPKTFHLVLDADVSFTGEGEVQHWQKGLPLGRLSALADAVLGLGLAFDIGVTLNTKKFPPELNVEPKLTDLQVDLKVTHSAPRSQPDDRDCAGRGIGQAVR